MQIILSSYINSDPVILKTPITTAVANNGNIIVVKELAGDICDEL